MIHIKKEECSEEIRKFLLEEKNEYIEQLKREIDFERAGILSNKRQKLRKKIIKEIDEQGGGQQILKNLYSKCVYCERYLHNFIDFFFIEGVFKNPFATFLKQKFSDFLSKNPPFFLMKEGKERKEIHN